MHQDDPEQPMADNSTVHSQPDDDQGAQSPVIRLLANPRRVRRS
jgi:hypothetical protein